MSGGRIWLTRGDCFEDEQEICYGLNLLRTGFSGETSLSSNLEKLLIDIRCQLKACYIVSTTCDRTNSFVATNYARKGGFRVGFNANLAELLRQGWEHQDNPKYANDRFDHFEGWVVYEVDRQREIAKVAAEAAAEFFENRDGNDRFGLVKYLHLIDALITCVILFKRPEFFRESEYRVCLVRRHEAQNFEKKRHHGGRDIYYVDIYSPLVKEIAELEVL